MINILPIQEKKKILTEYRLRLGVVAVFAIMTLVLSSFVLLIPSYLLAVSKYKGLSENFLTMEAKQGRVGQGDEIGAQISNINKKINLFLKGGARVESAPPQSILNILNMKGDRIKIHGFTYDATTGKGRMVVVGVSDDRDSLAQFIEVLKKEPTFTKVELPISSYVKSTNIDFSVVIEREIKK